MNTLLLWAKTSNSDPNIAHPLICHLIDVANVAQTLWDVALATGVKDDLAATLALTPEAAGGWLAFWAGLHDLGKACPPFQRQHEPSRLALSAAGVKFPQNSVIKTPHGHVTTHALRTLLPDRVNLDIAFAAQIAGAIGGHHGSFPDCGAVDELWSAQLGGQDWTELRTVLFDRLAETYSIGSLPRPGVHRAEPDVLMALAGFVSVADWIGSMEEHFPPAGTAVDVEAYAAWSREQAARAVHAAGWSRLPPDGEPWDFARLFDVPVPRPLQCEAISLSERLDTPSLVIVEAPMGEGKTEAALYLADRWKSRLQQSGLYVAMPTQATSNQMFGRVNDVLQRRYSAARVNLQLIHGNAPLSADFERLRQAAGGDDPNAGIVAEEWFLPHKRGLLAPFAVGTVDQAFLSVLCARHAFVRLFGLGHKTVVFDEVHAYDAYMSTLLERLLAWLAAMQTSVVVLSATLSLETRRRLVAAYAGVDVPGGAAYPAITWAAGDHSGSPTRAAGIVPFPASRGVDLTLEWTERAPQALAETLRTRLAGGGCATVICNTVDRAQTVYQALRAERVVPPEDLTLFHARFPFNQRDRLERLVTSRFGRNPGLRPQRAIVVATQVIEQSLDLDFDLMVTDLAPVDLVLQRSGRLHRHERAMRPAALSTPRLLIARPDLADGIPVFGADGHVYAPYVLLRSYLALLDRAGIRIPDEMRVLIEAVYGDQPACDGQPQGVARTDGGDGVGATPRGCPNAEAWIAALNDARGHWEGDLAKAAAEAKARLIPPPGPDWDAFATNFEEDSPDLHVALQALTRLSEPTVTLVCLHGRPDAPALDPRGRYPVDLTAPPRTSLSRALARRRVSLSHRGLVNYFLAQSIPAGWRRHPWLRHCHLAVFGPDGALAGTPPVGLRLDPELGLVIAKKEVR